MATIFPGIDVLIHSRNAQFSTVCIVQFEIFASMLAGDEISILADVDDTIRAGQKLSHIRVNPFSRFQINRILPQVIRLAINTDVLRLELHDLFEVGMDPSPSAEYWSTPPQTGSIN